jgi:predicted nucleotidyltransferase
MSDIVNKTNSNFIKIPTSMNRNEVIQILKKLQPDLNTRYGLSALALFGSVARGEEHVSSDIDVLIDLKENTSANFFNIVFLIQDTFYPVKVDIVSKKGIKPAYFQAIANDLIYV